MNISPPTSSGGLTRPGTAPATRPRSSSHFSGRTSRPGSALYSDDDHPQKTAVKVAVRVRPPLDPSDPGFDLIPHRFRGSTCHVGNPTSLTVESSQGKKLFVFDRVFSDKEEQGSVWEYVSESVNSFVQGYNVSLLAYGQSGAGKSYTMGTSGPGEQMQPKRQGIIPRAATELFEKLSGSSGRPSSSIGPSGLRQPKRYTTSMEPGDRNWQMKATYVEIYQEQLRDLLVPDLAPPHERNQVAIREDTKGRIILTGLHQVTINSVDDLLDALNFGSSIRQTDATAINSKSSRSHAVFSLNLIQKTNKASTGSHDKKFSTSADAMNGTEHWVTIDSKLHFVDLAGSERLKNSGLSGERAKEGISINAGLASLGKVISQLSSRASGSHVSYRDSRLTRLLQDSLGGNAITYMIACVNPVEFHLSETLNTVQYAQRARAIQSKPQIQQRAEDGDKQLVIDRLRSEVAFLRDQIRHSERTERRNTPPQERGGRKNERENELQNQLLDVQENYSALSQRHAKLISEIAKSKGEDPESMPALKGALDSASLDRLNRSNTFAEAVEQVILEYEKTIQSLESSLSNTRSSLSTSESSLLEREAKLVYMEAVTQQLQARVHKAMDREQKSENYLRDLEGRLEGVSSGEEKHHIVIQDLRKELMRIRESESSAEEYISTLEERLAEAEQDTDIMQREIRRLEHVVERQRTVGKMDGLLQELDNLRREEIKAESAGKELKQEHTQSDMFHDRLVATTSASHPNGEMLPHSAEEEWKSFGPMEGDEESISQISEPRHVEVNGHVHQPNEAEKMHSQAQYRAIADKLETVTIELFDVRVENETTAAELEDVSRKYQIALSTLAELQDAIDEAKTRPSAFLGKNGQPAEDGRASSSHVLRSDLSSRGESPTLVELSETGLSENGERPISVRKEETIADHIRRLKRANAEKEINMAEVTENYSQLQDQHKDALNYIEELKEELARGPQTQAGAQKYAHSQNALRRSMSPTSPGKDRESRIHTRLRDLAAENLQGRPLAIQSFEINISAAATESRLRNEKVQALEAELASVKSERDVKNTMIAGLTRERSSRVPLTLDTPMLSGIREQIQQSHRELARLRESDESRDKEFGSHISALQESLTDSRDAAKAPQDHVPGEFPSETSVEDVDKAGSVDGTSGEEKPRSAEVVALHKWLADWESKHRATLETMKTTEQQLIATVGSLESSLAHAEKSHSERAKGSNERSPDSAVDYEAEKTRQLDQVTSLQREIDAYRASAEAHAAKVLNLENSYAKIMKEVEHDAKSRQVTESDLRTHRDLVATLEQQIEQQKSLAAFHQSGLKSIEAAHSKELDDLRVNLLAHQDTKLTEQVKKHQESTSALQNELTKANMELSELMHSVVIAVDEERDGVNLRARLRSIADERRMFSSSSGDATEALGVARAEVQSAKQISVQLDAKVKELSSLNEQMLLELEKTSVKERKSSQLVQDLEEQLNTAFDHSQTVQNRMSATQKEKDKELDEHRQKVTSLENQLADFKRSTITSSHSQRDSNGQDNSLRKSASQQTLPSPPPAIPLPPLPGNMDAPPPSPRKPPPTSDFPSPPGSPLQPQLGGAPPPPQITTPKPDPALQAQVEEQESRLKTIEKHLFAEKQLTQTLEEALVDLENQANRGKAEVEAWKRKCREVEEEASGLRREKGTMRNSLQAVEEERDRRIRAENARQQLQERMEALGRQQSGGGGKKKGKGALNCF